MILNYFYLYLFDSMTFSVFPIIFSCLFRLWKLIPFFFKGNPFESYLWLLYKNTQNENAEAELTRDVLYLSPRCWSAAAP